MNARYTWFKLFAAGTALVIVTSATTALAMTGLERNRSRQTSTQTSALTTETGGITSGGRSQSGFNAGGEASETRSTLLAAITAEASSQPSVPAASESTQSTGQSTPAETSAPVTPAPSPTSAPAAPRQTTATTKVDAIGSASLKSGTTAGTSSTAKVLSASQASAIAVRRIATAGLRVLATEFESGDYPPKYEVKLSDGTYKYEVAVHAVTGLVLEVERERL